MEAVGDFTDTNRIRGVLGFTDRDLPDSQIIEMEPIIELEIELYNWFPTYKTSYDTWFNNGSPTDADRHLINLLKSYSTYYAAYIVCSGLEMLAQRTITDSKMTASRFSNVRLEDIRDRMAGKAASAKELIADDVGITLTTTAPTLFSSASPNFDPVEG